MYWTIRFNGMTVVLTQPTEDDAESYYNPSQNGCMQLNRTTIYQSFSDFIINRIPQTLSSDESKKEII